MFPENPVEFTLKVRINKDRADFIRSRITEITGEECTDEVFVEFIGSECEYWLCGDVEEFDKGLDDSIEMMLT
jgi:hypothetical protein